MGAARRSRARASARAAVLITVLVAGSSAVLDACGTAVPGSPGSATTAPTSSRSPASPSPTSSSGLPPGPSATSTGAADVIVPASVLETSLVTDVLAKYYTVTFSDSGEYPTIGGLAISSLGEYVSGDSGCRTMFNAHTASPTAFAYVSMANATAWFEEVAESYATVADARDVMAENVAQASACRTFTMRSTDGDVVPFQHTVTTTGTGEVDSVLHHFNGRTTQYLYEFHLFERRVGGELMNILWASTTFRADPSSAASAQFQKVVDEYRKEHPRRGGSGDDGGDRVSPVTAVPTGGPVLPRRPSTSDLTMARSPR